MFQESQESLYQYSEREAIDALLVIVSTVFIFMMHSGFAMVEVGSVREKNAHNILIKNLYVVCAGVIAFWLIGYGFAFGQTEHKGKFIGSKSGTFAASNFDHDTDDHYLAWIFQFAFAGTAATIVSGSLAERCHLPTFLIFSAIMTAFIYPVVVSWTWGGGWLAKRGFFDFAGSGVVHLVGGSSGLIGAFIIGPRHGKERNPSTRKDVFQDGEFTELTKKTSNTQSLQNWIRERENLPFKPYSVPFMVIGTLILWVSWLFFNGGSAYTMFGPRH